MVYTYGAYTISVRFSGEGANLVMLVFKVEKEDCDNFIKFTSTQDVAFTRVNHTYVYTLVVHYLGCCVTSHLLASST